MAHSNPAPGQGAYSASKAAFANLLQHLAEEVPAQETQIINVHPGAIFTRSAGSNGLTEDSLPWDNGKSPRYLSSILADGIFSKSSRRLCSLGVNTGGGFLAWEIRMDKLGCGGIVAAQNRD